MFYCLDGTPITDEDAAILLRHNFNPAEQADADAVFACLELARHFKNIQGQREACAGCAGACNDCPNPRYVGES